MSIFFGYEKDYESFKKKEGIEDTPEEKEQKKKSQNENIIKISSEEPKEISEEIMTILKRTRHREDPYKIYMQSNIDFYDRFYNSEGNQEDELLLEARKIRRTYKNYSKYLYANHIRDLYIERLIEKYGGENRFALMYNTGGIDEWIPPFPIYSRHAPDYQMVKMGIFDFSDDNDWDDDKIEEMMKELTSQINPDAIDYIVDICTDMRDMKEIEEYEDSESSSRYTTNYSSVSVTDLENLQKIFRSWYRDEDEDKKEIEEDDGAFSMTPRNIRKKYYEERPYKNPGGLTKSMNGEDLGEENNYDPNEMIFDDETQRAMPRKEYEARSLVRQLKEHGWSEMKLMKVFNVGSKYERKLLQRKAKNKKIARKQAISFLDDVTGNSGALGDFDVSIDDPVTEDYESFKKLLWDE